KHGWDIAAGSISYEGLKEECIRAVEEAGTGTSYRIRITLSETGLVAVTASPVPPLTADPSGRAPLHEKDEITETSIANVAFCRDEGWVTPDASTGCLTGVFRRWLLEKGRIKEGIVMKGANQG
ncbi:hypothetical protein MPER_02822, partial [Moniliophthora perniciosa FA553]